MVKKIVLVVILSIFSLLLLVSCREFDKQAGITRMTLKVNEPLKIDFGKLQKPSIQETIYSVNLLEVKSDYIRVKFTNLSQNNNYRFVIDAKDYVLINNEKLEKLHTTIGLLSYASYVYLSPKSKEFIAKIPCYSNEDEVKNNKVELLIRRDHGKIIDHDKNEIKIPGVEDSRELLVLQF